VKRAMLFTDGSCLGNPGPGGWACLLRCDSVETELSGTEAHTTNNRMELQAVIAGLSALKEPSAATVVTDSQYIQLGMTRYLSTWISRSWILCR
jgi:ribonuclease HI